SFTLDPGQSMDLTVTITSSAPTAQYLGEVRLVPRRTDFPTLHLPVAFITAQSSVTLASSCSPDTIPENGISSCQITATNTSLHTTTVDLRTTLSSKLKVVSVNNAFFIDNRTVEKPNVTLAGANPGVPSVSPGELFGYLPLDAFGVT